MLFRRDSIKDQTPKERFSGNEPLIQTDTKIHKEKSQASEMKELESMMVGTMSNKNNGRALNDDIRQRQHETKQAKHTSGNATKKPGNRPLRYTNAKE